MRVVKLFSLLGLAFFSLSISLNCTAKDAVMDYNTQFGFSLDTANVSLAKYYRNGAYVINDTIDLNRRTLYIPANSTLSVRGGVIRNGIINGDKTKLKYKKGCAVFDSVHITGTWIVGSIRSSMFKDLSYDNSLKDVFALTNPKIHNTVVIEKGAYQVTAFKPKDVCVQIESNTDVILDGDIYLTPNGYVMYSIVRLEGDNITLKGKGSINGDKYTHTSQEGEWGMGIFVMGGKKNRISGVTVKDCWGDCIYITNNADGLVIDKCELADGRRQGISVISAKNVLIKNCTISKVRGTPPGYAIDVETNKGDTVLAVTIKNLQIYDCFGGILTTDGMAQDAYIDEVIVRNCTIRDIDTYPFKFKRTNKVVVRNCDIQVSDNQEEMFCYGVSSLYLERSLINGQRIKKDINQNTFITIDNSNIVVIQ